MKVRVFLTYLVFGLTTTAFAQNISNFHCQAIESKTDYSLTIVDVGDQEGLVLMETIGEFFAYYDFSESQHRFIFGFEAFNQGLITQLHEITINHNGSKGVANINGEIEALTCSSTSEAETNAFKTMLDLSLKYETMGQDNNYIELSDSLPTNGNTIHLYGKKNLVKALQKCLFIKEGAYGQHITSEQQSTLTNNFLNAMKNIKPLGFILHKDTALVDDIVNSNCVIEIKLNKNRSLFMDAHSFD
ncbi:MAG: hypothetical protein R3B45_13155 [Bdellovibrionota bacterium]